MSQHGDTISEIVISHLLSTLQSLQSFNTSTFLTLHSLWANMLRYSFANGHTIQQRLSNLDKDMCRSLKVSSEANLQPNIRFRLRGPTLGRKVESIQRLCGNHCLDSPILYRLGNAKCKIFEKKQLTFPNDLSKILHLSLPARYFSIRTFFDPWTR